MRNVGRAEQSEFIKAWNEVRECAALIRSGRGKIVSVKRPDGSTYRYTRRR